MILNSLRKQHTLTIQTAKVRTFLMHFFLIFHCTFIDILFYWNYLYNDDIIVAVYFLDVILHFIFYFTFLSLQSVTVFTLHLLLIAFFQHTAVAAAAVNFEFLSVIWCIAAENTKIISSFLDIQHFFLCNFLFLFCVSALHIITWHLKYPLQRMMIFSDFSSVSYL